MDSEMSDTTTNVTLVISFTKDLRLSSLHHTWLLTLLLHLFFLRLQNVHDEARRVEATLSSANLATTIWGCVAHTPAAAGVVTLGTYWEQVSHQCVSFPPAEHLPIVSIAQRLTHPPAAHRSSHHSQAEPHGHLVHHTWRIGA